MAGGGKGVVSVGLAVEKLFTLELPGADMSGVQMGEAAIS